MGCGCSNYSGGGYNNAAGGGIYEPDLPITNKTRGGNNTLQSRTYNFRSGVSVNPIVSPGGTGKKVGGRCKVKMRTGYSKFTCRGRWDAAGNCVPCDDARVPRTRGLSQTNLESRYGRGFRG